MKWTVIWTNEAEEELTNIWLRATNKRAISQASDRIELELKRDADKKGEVVGRHRVLHLPPLAVAYEVIPDDCMVRVIHVERETNGAWNTAPQNSEGEKCAYHAQWSRRNSRQAG